MKICPVCEKEHNPEPLKHFNNVDIKNFENQVVEFMRQRLDNILIESLKDNEKTLEYSKLIDFFHIGASEKPIYQNLNKVDELDDLINHIINLAMEMEVTIGKIVDDYEEEPESELFQSLQMIWKLIGRFIKQIKTQKALHRVEEDADIREMRYQFYEFIKKNFDKYLIDRIIPPILKGMKAGNIHVYKLILRCINEFLSNLGINTVELKENQEIDYELCEPIEANDNETDDCKLNNCIKEIIQLPYVFDRNHVVKEGKIIGWRFSQ